MRRFRTSDSGVQLVAWAPIAVIAHLAESTELVSRRRVDRSHVTAPCGSGLVGKGTPCRLRSGSFGSSSLPLPYQFRPSIPTVRGKRLKPSSVRVRISRWLRASRPTAESQRLQIPFLVGVRISLLRTSSRAASSEGRAGVLKHQVGISKFSPPTNHGPLAQWESRRPMSDRQRIETAMDCQQGIKPMGDDHKRGQMDPERKAAW